MDEAVNCLNNGLLEAAACMKRKTSKGLKSSKWFAVECKGQGAGSARRVNARIDCCMLTARNH